MRSVPSQPGKRDRTRAAIVQAGIQVLAERGESASIDELMCAAGMARGTFYNYFTDRDDVWRAVLLEVQGQAREHVMVKIPQGLPPEGVLACMLMGLLRFALSHPHLGWAIVRLGTGKDWLTQHHFEDRLFPRSDDALQALVAGVVPFSIARAFVESTLNMALRRLLEGHINLGEAQLLVGLSLRGLGGGDADVERALQVAKVFSMD